VEYDYGSPPVSNYTYRNFIQHLAPALPKNDKVFYHRESLQWRNNLNKIPLDLFRNICHWKSRRRFEKVLKNKDRKVNAQWSSALQQLNQSEFSDEGIDAALKLLVELDGVAVPTASALLTAWKPEQFGIIDFRVRHVLDMPNNTSYVVFRSKLLQLQQELQLDNCNLRQIEMALWHYYPIKMEGKNSRRGIV